MKCRPGDIGWACPPSARGEGKTRPVVVVSQQGESIAAVAVTSTPIDSTDWRYVVLPFDPQGSASTRLKKPCWAVCDWLIELAPEDIAEQKGHVPSAVLAEIRHKVSRLI